jgi:hypothetical protein
MPLFRSTLSSRLLLAWLVLAALGACATRQSPPPPPAVARRPLPPPVVPPAAIVLPPIASVPVPAVAASAAESVAVAARFPDPPVAYDTPAFAPGHAGFTSNSELQAALRRLVHDGAPGATTVRLLEPGTSQRGAPIEALLFTRDPDAAAALPVRPARPTVLLVGQQHGDEPAGAEALLVIAEQLAHGTLEGLLDRINVVVLPRANPDGAEAGRRLTASGIDLNRDHLLLRTPEAQAQAQLVRQFAPLVVVDAHEFTAGGHFVDKFGAAQRDDLLLQYAMTANLPEFITKASEEWFRRPLLAQLKNEALRVDWYYTATPDLNDGKLAMGSAQPDNERNVNGLRNAVSLLIESRGVGLGQAHLKRRVFSQVTALSSLLDSAAARGADLVKLRQYVDNEVSAKACQGTMVVEAQATASEYRVTLLDPITGADRPMTVAWDSTLALDPRKTRPRPCGYWLAADQTDAVMRLRALGVQVQRVEELGVVRGETYRETSRRTDTEGEAGNIAEGAGVVRITAETVPVLMDVGIGSYYVGLDQPFANLAIAALEPDTGHSYFAHRIIGSVAAQARLLARPEMRTTTLP